MKITDYIGTSSILGVSGLFFAVGSFGVIDGNIKYDCKVSANKSIYTYENDAIRLTAEFSEEKNGAVIRRDTFENLTDSPFVLEKLVSRFRMDGDLYEVYTQFNGWQHESEGSWQPLVTQVTAASEGIRTCEGAAPIMALHNLHSRATTVFHLVPNAQWEMNVRKFPISDKEHVVLETGFSGIGMHMSVMPHEKIELPKVIFFRAKNRDDLDMYKLHSLYNELYPRRRMPVLYNSWMYCFDRLDADGLYRQVDTAAELGVEAFMIDAGWFGGDDWYSSVGDWVENPNALAKGGLTALSEYVRSKDMIFGLWFEPERAASTSNSVKAHPDYYIAGSFLDFANPDAREYMLESVCSQIDKYKIGWVKFDFNASIPYDPSGNSFYRYMQGQRIFIETLKKKYPDLYITNCASGGARMELGQSTLYDSYWPSDNESILDELTILKNSMKRLPPSHMERWAVLKWCDGFPWYAHEEKHGFMLCCRGGTWENVEIVKDGHLFAYMTGGPIGFSCDIAEFPEEYKEKFKAHIAKFKTDREFYMNASARLLADTPSITAIEYSDDAMSKIVINVFTKQTHACELTVYPAVDENARYRFGESLLDGRNIAEDGIRVDSLRNNDCAILELTKI